MSKALPEGNDLSEKAVYRVMDTACFLWKNMDDAHIIYDKRSGHSQALNNFAREIFAILEDGPCSSADIISELAEILERPLDDELILHVEKNYW